MEAIWDLFAFDSFDENFGCVSCHLFNGLIDCGQPRAYGVAEFGGVEADDAEIGWDSDSEGEGFAIESAS